MIEAFLIISTFLLLIVGGKAILAAMIAWPFVGKFVAWYSGLIFSLVPLPDGIVSNILYGLIGAQTAILLLWALLHGIHTIKLIVTNTFRWVKGTI